MNAAQLHLAFTHVPVVLAFVALALLIAGMVGKNSTLLRTSYWMFIIAGLTAIPVYFSGEEAEHIVEDIAGVQHDSIEEHEEFAGFSMIAAIAAAAIAITAMITIRYSKFVTPTRTLLVIAAIASCTLMARTAHLGGKIRHTEMNASNIEVVGDHQHQASANPTATVEPVTIALINNQKWNADDATNSNVDRIVDVATDKRYEDVQMRDQFLTEMQSALDRLVKECKMKGADHDALHVWLERVMGDVKKIKADSENYTSNILQLRSDVLVYSKYFN